MTQGSPPDLQGNSKTSWVNYKWYILKKNKILQRFSFTKIFPNKVNIKNASYAFTWGKWYTEMTIMGYNLLLQ